MTSRNAAIAALLISVFAFSTSRANAAELKGETSRAWQSYIEHEAVLIEQRAANPRNFLWVDSKSDLYNKARAGSILVEPLAKNTPLHVPSGLIHHWIGAVFIPDATINDVLSVTRDYPHYKDYFRPGVADARAISVSPGKDEFIIRFVNGSVLSKSALEGTYQSDFVHLDDKRFYSISLTTRMLEIHDAGEPGEHASAPEHGSGYIWRLYSTARMEERDGGVLLELEAIALSRDIPAPLRVVVDPIIRRVSRESLEKSLTETADAARNHAEACLEQIAHSHFGPSQIIVAGVCSGHPDPHHADDSDFRTERLAGNAGR